MANYVDKVTTEKTFVPNIVIQIGVNYFCVRQPDSGLTVAAPYDTMVGSLVLNSAAIDIRKVNTTIANYTFRLLDKNGLVSTLVAGTGATLIGAEVTIWIGRNRKRSTAEAHDFAGYYQLPKTRIKKIEHNDNTYLFSTAEDTNRIARAIYAPTSALNGDILSGTTTIIMRDAIDEFPSAGYLRIDNEILSYSSKNDGTKTFSGVVRGEFGTVAAAHEANVSAYASEVVTANPLDLLLQILISGGGGGTYDVLNDGCGIDEALVDVAAIEALRDSLFPTTEVTLEMSNIESALRFLETEILQPFNLRFTYGLNAKLNLVILDRAIFVPFSNSIDEDSISSYPKWTVDETKIVNRIRVNWDWDEGEGKFLKFSEYINDASVTAYGLRNPLTFNFKGIKSSLDGQNLVDEYARILFARFATPVAEVEFRTQINKSLQNIGDKVFIESGKIPSPFGGLTFASDMEIVSRAINYQTHEVSFKFAFTSFTKIRSGFIAPSDLIQLVQSQKLVGITSGRGAKYQVGFYMRLWNELTQTYEADAPNKIIEIADDENGLLLESGFGLLAEDGTPLGYDQAPFDLIKFENDFSTTLTTNHRLRFAKYNDAAVLQKRHCFISDDGNNFDDNKPTYKVTY